MIERINFIEKKKFEITIAALTGLIGAVLLISLLTGGLVWWQGEHLAAKEKRLKGEIAGLKAERERLLGQAEELQGSAPYLKLKTVLKKNPSWNKVLFSLSKSLPPKVWLASVKSADQEGGTKELVLNGEAKNPGELTQFLSNLGQTPHFENIELVTSREETPGMFHFSITCDIRKVPFED